MPRPGAPVIAIVNTNADLVSVLRDHLQTEGYTVVTAYVRDIKDGKTDLISFLTHHDPDAVIYDVAVPYEDNWVLYKTLRQLPEFRARPVVLTTVNKRIFEERVGHGEVVEIQGGRAQDFEPVVDAVRAVLTQSAGTVTPTRRERG